MGPKCSELLHLSWQSLLWDAYFLLHGPWEPLVQIQQTRQPPGPQATDSSLRSSRNLSSLGVPCSKPGLSKLCRCGMMGVHRHESPEHPQPPGLLNACPMNLKHLTLCAVQISPFSMCLKIQKGFWSTVNPRSPSLNKWDQIQNTQNIIQTSRNQLLLSSPYLTER